MLPESRLEVVVSDDRLVQLADEVGTAALWRFEQLQACNVHRVFTRFADEEHRVGRRDQLHRRDGTLLGEVTMTNTGGRAAGRVAFITGAARGQGREHAVRLAEEGADIIAVDVCGDIEGVGYPGATEADLDETAALVEKLDRRIVAEKADVRDLEGLRAALQRGVDELGRPDVVVTNAGISGVPSPAASVDETDWQTMLDINLTGVMHTVKVALPHMSDGRGGSIILVSSMLGLRGGGYMSAYASAKHELVGLMHSLANELAPQWIRVNSIHPGNILTPMLDNDHFRRTVRPDLAAPTMADATQVIGHFHLLPKPVI